MMLDLRRSCRQAWQYERDRLPQQQQDFDSSTFDEVAILRLDISDFLFQNTLKKDCASDPDQKKIQPSEVLVPV